jgi:hypothetical protein
MKEQDRSDDAETVLGFLLKLPKEALSRAASAAKTVYDRLVYPDLERQRKHIQVEREKQGLAQERLVTFEKALDVEKKITDPELKELYLKGLRSTLETSGPYPELPQIGTVNEKKDDQRKQLRA